MSEPVTFTPGPWTVGEVDKGWEHDGQRVKLWNVHPFNIQLFEADARLIAAAPEMYAYLAEVVELVPDTPGDELYDRGIALLAKIKGEA